MNIRQIASELRDRGIPVVKTIYSAPFLPHWLEIGKSARLRVGPNCNSFCLYLANADGVKSYKIRDNIEEVFVDILNKVQLADLRYPEMSYDEFVTPADPNHIPPDHHV